MTPATLPNELRSLTEDHDGIDGDDEVETCLRCTIDDDCARQTKSFELRVATSLARFLRDQCQPAEARETLASVFDWFTEDFNTPDLTDTKALLNELS